MATFQTITNGYSDTVPAVTLNQKSPCGTAATTFWSEHAAGSVPASQAIDLKPQVVVEWRDDPTKAARRNWTKIQRSGQISMTPLSVGRNTVSRFVVSRDRKFWTYKRAFLTCGSNCSAKWGMNRYVTGWTENSSFDELSITLPRFSTTTGDYESQILDAINTTQSAAFAESLSSYDVLTELAEARETLSFMHGKVQEAARVLQSMVEKDPTTFKKARSLKLNARLMSKSTDKGLRKAGGRWMEYRYALMPLIYSMGDIHELMLNRQNVYKTTRHSEHVTVHETSDPGSSSTRCLYDTFDGTALIKSTVKTAYNEGALQRVLGQTAFNPFKTAWELIPYSFVIDWFINVGDIITSHTSLDFSSQKVCCTSVKRTWAHQTYYKDTTSDVSIRTDVANACFPAATFTDSFQRSVNALARAETQESYERWLWTKPNPVPTVNPYLNWKRFLDSLALSHQPVKKILRNL